MKKPNFNSIEQFQKNLGIKKSLKLRVPNKASELKQPVESELAEIKSETLLEELVRLKKTLTKGQLDVLTAFENWLAEGTENHFVLSGAAGTGKTYLTNLLVKTLKSNGFSGEKSVVVSAPTHKAVKVVQTSTGLPSVTCASWLGLKPNTKLEEVNLKNMKFYQDKYKLVDRCDFFIHDESSMLSDFMLKMILDRADEFDCRLIFILDECQLPPVKGKLHADSNQPIIPVIDLGNVHRLSEVVRYDGVTLEMATFVRKHLTVPMPSLSGFKGEGLYVHSDPSPENIIKIFEADFTKNKVLSYTNKVAESYNIVIRDILSGGSRDKVAPGDILIGTKIGKGLSNSEECSVISVELIEKYYPTGAYDVYECEVEYYNSIKDDGTFQVGKIFVLSPTSYAMYLQYHDMIKTQCINNRRWSNYYEFLESHDFRIMDHLASNIGDYKAIPKSIDYGYAITIHKSQGSTYKNTAVILNSLSSAGADIKNRLMYVAFTRHSDNLHIIQS